MWHVNGMWHGWLKKKKTESIITSVYKAWANGETELSLEMRKIKKVIWGEQDQDFSFG